MHYNVIYFLFYWPSHIRLQPALDVNLLFSTTSIYFSVENTFTFHLIFSFCLSGS
jgi:hypothetical protein